MVKIKKAYNNDCIQSDSIDFDRLIQDHLVGEQEEESKKHEKKIGKYYPSEIGNCLRKTYYSYIDPLTPGNDSLKVFKCGNMIHNIITEILESTHNPHITPIENELSLEKNLSIDGNDFEISGRVDNIIILESDGKKYLIEVKSCSYISYIKKPQKHNVAQLLLYMDILNIDNGIMLYIDKKNLKTASFDIKRTKENTEHVLNRFKHLHTSLLTHKLPEPESKQDPDISWMCKYCPYTSECKSDKNPPKKEV